MVDDDEQPSEQGAPDFGPSGYLPPRASKRARKIVLRAPLGLQWVVGALLIGVLLLGVGLAMLGGDDAPAPPFEPVVADVGGLPPASTATTDLGLDVLVVAAGGRPRVFLPSTAGTLPSWCATSRLLEDGAGGGWRPTGRGVQGTPSLQELPSTVVEGALYVDPTTPLPAARPDADGPSPACG